MSLDPGRSLGPYEILEPAGKGGMGEVYKAKDTRLDRIVAVKILPAEIAASPDFKERFNREAKAISSLNHANICILHDIGHEEGIDYLVMEYLEGETLSDRLSRGSIPYDEMLQIAVQIASGLDSAHQRGLVHRDLKPSNVMLTSGGAKLLDFGLAKMSIQSANPAISAITQTTPLTGANTILGTMQYMAPEQLEGKEADARSDIFAFGAIMYEMATGKRAFEGSSSATLIAAIIEREPVSISVIMPNTPPLFERLVKKCLSKEPQKRWQSMSDLSDELRWISQAGSQVGLPAHLAARRKFKFDLARVVGAVTIVTTVLFAYLYFTERSGQKRGATERYNIDIRQGLKDIFWPRISPDGKAVAFHADDSLGVNRIWVRPINSLEAYPLLNTENAKRFYWSNDGRQIAFFVGEQMKRIPMSGGQAQLVCQGVSGSDGSWGSKDYIIFDGGTGDTMKVVPASGGVPRPASLIDTSLGESFFAWPWFLPDGEHFIFRATVAGESSGRATNRMLKLGSLSSTDSRLLYEFPHDIDRIEYSDEGYILYIHDNNLMGLPFDAGKLEVTGDPKPIAMGIGTADNTYAFSTTHDGTISYQTGEGNTFREIAVFDRSGTRIETVGPLGAYYDISLSSDETKLAYSASEGVDADADIYVYDLKRNVSSRLTFDAASDLKPIWSPDGSEVYFISNRGGSHYAIYKKRADGEGQAELVYKIDTATVVVSDFSPDGELMIIRESQRNPDVAIYSLAEKKRTVTIANSSKLEGMGKVSPNGEYLAYVSAESGQWEVYVKRLDGTGGKWQVSSGEADGGNPIWNGKGDELFYINYNDEFLSVRVNTQGKFESEMPVKLFSAHLYYPNFISYAYDVSADGQRFYICMRPGGLEKPEIVIVKNWASEFKN